MSRYSLTVAIVTVTALSGCGDQSISTGKSELSPAAKKADSAAQDAMREFMQAKQAQSKEEAPK